MRESLKISESVLRKTEWAVAILVTALIVALHFIFMLHAGGLWRDEAGAINLAELPSLKDVWHNLYFDSFPVFWVLVVRFWWSIGLGSDLGFRVLGFITGLLVLAAIWFTARCFKLKYPVFALVLIALNPLMIVYGDSMRAWGWGLLWITLEFGLIGLVLENPTRAKVIWATLVGIAAVQSTYHNSVLLAVLGCAGAITALARGSWRRALLVTVICAVAGTTMLAYLNVFRIGQDHYSILRQPFSRQSFVDKLLNAISGNEAFLTQVIDLRLWWILLLLAGAVVVFFRFFPGNERIKNAQKELIWFAVTTILLAVPAYYLFLSKLRFVTQPWYYMPLITVVALSLEAIFAVAENWEQGRLFRLVAFLVILVAAIPPISGVIQLRMTNVDLIADRLNHSSKKNDLVIVSPYICAISFGRQYSGSGTSISVPPIDNLFHRYDVVKARMLQPDRNTVIQCVLDDAERDLKSGGDVWVVTFSDFGRKFDSKPRAPAVFPEPDMIQAMTIMDYWQDATAYFLQQHSLHHVPVTVSSEVPISKYEHASLFKFSGWRD